jgi:hypothetical protein
MKKYIIEIEYNESKAGGDYHVKVNGKNSPLPPRLRKWIARSYLAELFREP